MYLDNRHLMSFDYTYMLIIGANGCGKTYMSKRYIFKKALYNHKKFIWLRTNEKMIDAIKQNNGHEFFVDIKPHFKHFDGSVVGESIFVNGQHVGKFGAVSTFFNNKGASFNDYDYIVYDEFIDELVQKRLKNKTLAFIKTLEAIVRLKPNVKIILTANALDRGDEILQLFDFHIKDFGYYFNKKKRAVLWYVKDDEEYNKKHSESIAGRLMPEYMLNNKFKDRNYLYFDVLPDRAKYIYSLEGENGKMSIYSFNGELFVTPESDKTNKYCLVRNIDEMSATSTVIRKSFLDSLRNIYMIHKIRFKNQFVEKSFVYFIQ